MELPLFRNEEKFQVSMEIRPTKKNALLLYGDARNDFVDFVSIAMKDGFVEAR